MGSLAFWRGSSPERRAGKFYRALGPLLHRKPPDRGTKISLAAFFTQEDLARDSFGELSGTNKQVKTGEAAMHLT